MSWFISFERAWPNYEERNARQQTRGKYMYDYRSVKHDKVLRDNQSSHI